MFSDAAIRFCLSIKDEGRLINDPGDRFSPERAEPRGTVKLPLRQTAGMVASPSSDCDNPILPELLRQIPEGGPIGTVPADAAWDTRRCYTAIMECEAVPFGHSFGPFMDGDGAPWLTPDCQTAEIHIRIAPMNRFPALGTAEITRVA